MELNSNCCGAKTTEPDASGAAMCTDCKEHCEIDTVCTDCNNEEMSYKTFVENGGVCSKCAWIIANM